MQQPTSSQQNPQQVPQSQPTQNTVNISTSAQNEANVSNKQNASLFDIIDTITETIKSDFNQLVQDVQKVDNNHNENEGVESEKIGENVDIGRNQRQEDQQQGEAKLIQGENGLEEEPSRKQQSDHKQVISQDIENIRKKEKQLLQQLEQLRQKQRALLGMKDQQKDQNQQLEAEAQQSQQKEQQQQQQQQNFFYFLQSPSKTLSPVKKSRYPRRPKPKLVMPQPIVPEMSREEFEQKIKKMAGKIRSKVNKLNPLVKDNVKNLSQGKSLKKTKQIQQKNNRFVIQLPEIRTKKNTMKMSVTQNMAMSMEGNMSNLMEIDGQFEGVTDKAKEQSLDNKNIKKVKSVVEQIIKKVFQKITYKEKYGIKLDPVHHKYPMTTFRRKILEQKHNKQKQRYNSQNLRQSVLTQRKSIFDKSRKR